MTTPTDVLSNILSNDQQLSTMTHMFRLFKGVILGAPGSGKGTIAGRICRDFNLAYVCVGDMLRSQVRLQTPVGKEAEKYITKGDLVPDHVVNKLVLEELLVQYDSTSWLLDGYPRTHSQAIALDQERFFDRKTRKKIHLNSVISLVVPDDEIISRINDRWIHAPSGRVYNLTFNPPKVEGKDDVTGEDLVKRDDDKPESVKRRLEVFHKQMEPINKFYDDMGILQEFHGRSSNEIYPKVKDYLIDLIKTQLHPESPHLKSILEGKSPDKSR